MFYTPLDHTPNLPDCYETFQNTQKSLKTIKILKNQQIQELCFIDLRSFHTTTIPTSSKTIDKLHKH